MAKVPALRKRRALQIDNVLTSAFELISDRSFLVMGMAFVMAVLSQMMELASAQSLRSFDHSYVSIIWNVITFVLVAFGTMLLSMIGQGALAGVAVARKERGRVSSWPTFRRGLQQLPVLAVVALLGLGGILIGFVCLIVPGIILALMWSMIGPIAVVEGKGIIATFRRSKELTTGALRDIFLVIAVITVGTSIFRWAATTFAGSFFGGADNRLAVEAGPGAFLILTLIETLTMAVTIAVNAILYVELVERLDGPMTQQLSEIFE